MEDKTLIVIIYHHAWGDCDSLVQTYKQENIYKAEIFIKSLINDDDIILDYVIVGKDFTESIKLELKNKIFEFHDTFSGKILTV